MSERYERNGRIQRAFSYAYGGGGGCVRIEYGNIALKPVNDFVDSILVLILGELEIN